MAVSYSQLLAKNLGIPESELKNVTPIIARGGAGNKEAQIIGYQYKDQPPAEIEVSKAPEKIIPTAGYQLPPVQQTQVSQPVTPIPSPGGRIEYVSTPQGVISVGEYKAQQGMARTPSQFQPSIQGGRQVFTNLTQQSMVQPKPQTRLEQIKEKIGGIVGGLTEQKQREQALQRESQQIQAGQRQAAFTQSGRGTTVTYTKPYEKKELESAATGKPSEITQMGASSELARRENVMIQNVYDQDSRYMIQQLKATGQQLVDKEYQRLNAEVQSGRMTPEDANKRLEIYASNVDASNQNRLQQFNLRWEQTKGKQLTEQSKEYLRGIQEKAAVKAFVTTLPITFAAGAGIGYVSAAVPAIGTAVNVAGTGLFGYGIYNRIKTGEKVTPTEIGLFAAELAVFYLGAKAGGKLYASARTQQVQDALSRSNYEYTTRRLITREAEIAKLEIPEFEKARLIEAMRAGRTVKEVNYELTFQNSADANLVNKALPNRNIKFLEVVDSKGGFIERVGVGTIEITKGNKVYAQDILSGSRGVTDLKTGEFQSKTLSIIAERGKAPSRAIATKEKGRGMVITNKELGIRETRVKVDVTELGRLPTRTRKLTTESMRELLSMDKGKKVYTGEIQRVEKLQKKANIQLENLMKKPQELTSAQLREYTGEERGTFTRVPEPKPISKASKYQWNINKPAKFKGGKKTLEPIPTVEEEYTKAIIDATKEPVKSIDYPKIVGGEGKQKSFFEPSRSRFTGELKLEADQGMIVEASQASSAEAINTALLDVNTQMGKFQKAPTILRPVVIGGEITMDKLMRTTMTPSKTITSPILKLSSEQTNRILNPGTSREMMANAEALSNKQIDRLNTGVIQPTAQREKLEQQQIAKLETTQVQPPRMQVPTYPIINPPKVQMDVYPPMGTLGTGGGEFGYRKEISPRKRKGKYTASLSEAFFNPKTLELTEKQLKALGEKEFTGFESRPVISLKQPKAKKLKI